MKVFTIFFVTLSTSISKVAAISTITEPLPDLRSEETVPINVSILCVGNDGRNATSLGKEAFLEISEGIMVATKGVVKAAYPDAPEIELHDTSYTTALHIEPDTIHDKLLYASFSQRRMLRSSPRQDGRQLSMSCDECKSYLPYTVCIMMGCPARRRLILVKGDRKLVTADIPNMVKTLESSSVKAVRDYSAEVSKCDTLCQTILESVSCKATVTVEEEGP